MLCWTSSSTIPLPKYPKDSESVYYGTVIGSNIWMMFYNERERIDPTMFMMDTETNKIQTAECIHEDFGSTMIAGLTSDGPKLYMIRGSVEEIDEMTEYTIFVMDTTKNNLEWQKVMAFRYGDELESCEIIGDTMYILCTLEMELIVIDLSRKILVKTFELSDPVEIDGEMFEDGLSHATLIKHNDTLYIISQEDGSLTVNILENDEKLRVVNEVEYNNSEFCVFTAKGNTIFPKITEIESYDIETNCWSKTTVEEIAPARHLSIEKAFELNNKIYALVHLTWHDGHQHDIRVLDMKPKLSTICLTNVVDEVMAMENVDQVRNKLPGPLRSQLDSIINWRTADKENTNECELFEKRFDQICQVIRGMRDNGEICEKQEEKLTLLFKKEDIAFVFYNHRGVDGNYEEMEEDDEETETDDDDEMFDDDEMGEYVSDMEE